MFTKTFKDKPSVNSEDVLTEAAYERYLERKRILKLVFQLSIEIPESFSIPKKNKIAREACLKLYMQLKREIDLF